VKNKRDPDAKFRSALIPIEDYVEDRIRYAISLWASTGVGKTYFCLTAPKPIYIVSFEPKASSWALKTAYEAGFVQEGDVMVAEAITEALGSDPSMVRTLDEEKDIHEWTLDFLNFLLREKNEEGGTIAIDTATTFWHIVDEVEGESIREKRAAQKKDLFRFDYRYANKAFKYLIDILRGSNFNLIFTHHDESTYNAKGTEMVKKRKFTGNKKIGEWVDVQVRLRFEDVREDEDDEPEMLRWVEVEKCRMKEGLIGTEIDNPTFDRIVKELTR
tara:strand:- start:2491 stop:3309 length:819 start_codon:yes stop_codon:yes gene_type:complete